MKPIQDNERFTLSKIISDDLREYIIENKLSTGDKLPSERDLSTKMNVSRVIIREALRSLEATGIVTIKHGEGAFVNTDDPSVIFDHLLYFWKLKKQKAEELFELRYLLEKAAIEQIIIKPDNKYLDQLLNLNQKMRIANNPKIFKKYDTKFHTGLIHASKNELFSQLGDVIVQYFSDIPSILLTQHEKDMTVEEHFIILRALKEGNSKKALNILDKHLQRSKTHIKENRK